MKIFAGMGAGGRGSHVGLIANASLLVAIAAVAVAMLLERATQGPNAPLVAVLAPKTAKPAGAAQRLALREAIVPRFERLDPTPTASISRPIVLDPCLGHAK